MGKVCTSKNKGKGINQFEYSWIIESLMFIMNCIKPESKMSKFTINLSMDHLREMKRALKYLRYIMDYELHYTDYLVVLEGYSNVN
jgi:hypothetical protein